MASLNDISSEALPAPSAGLASILRDRKAILGASNGRVLGVVEAIGPQSVFVSSSPASSICEADVGADEFKEEDVWAAESRSCQADLARSLQIHQGCHHHGLPSLCPRINELNLNGPAKNVGVFLGCAKVDVELADTLVLGVKAKKRVNGARTDHDFGLLKQRASGQEVVKSFYRQRERGFAVSDVPENVPELYHQPQLQEALVTSQKKTASCRSMVALMIPQVRKGMDNQLCKVYAEGGQSAPVQVPDWSKIMAKTNGNPIVMKDDDGEEGDNKDDDDRLPPHELLAKEYARSQMTAFSVCEGHGRTLKGRDLSRVRDAVWSQMGFAD